MFGTKKVKYKKGDPFVGEMECIHCHKKTPAWQSSGMSACEPHFYCNKCSNAVIMDSCKKFTWDSKVEIDDDLLNTISNLLPECPCGGRFKPGANPKCKSCNAEFKHQNSPLKRLTDPHVILVDGACMCDEKGTIKYRVTIK